MKIDLLLASKTQTVKPLEISAAIPTRTVRISGSLVPNANIKKKKSWPPELEQTSLTQKSPIKPMEKIQKTLKQSHQRRKESNYKVVTPLRTVFIASLLLSIALPGKSETCESLISRMNLPWTGYDNGVQRTKSSTFASKEGENWSQCLLYRYRDYRVTDKAVCGNLEFAVQRDEMVGLFDRKGQGWVIDWKIARDNTTCDKVDPNLYLEKTETEYIGTVEHTDLKLRMLKQGGMYYKIKIPSF